LSWLIYLNGIRGEFVFDDAGILERVRSSWDPNTLPKEKPYGPHLPKVLPGVFRQQVDRVIRQHRFLTYASYRRDAEIHVLRERWGWHASNIQLHSIAVGLVYALLRAYFPPFNAGIGAALFAAHPMASSSVQMIYGRSSLLCGVFYLSGLICALIGGPAWVLVLASFYYGWLSKQEILMLPVAIALTVWFIR
jgi:hypothetical protein